MDIPVKKTDLDEATVLAERLKLEKIAQVTTQKQNDILAHRVKELQDQVERLNRELDSAYVMVDISDNDADWGPVEYIGYPIHMHNAKFTVGFRQYRYAELLQQVEPDPCDDLEF